jgi:5-methyltetrahydrofolate--homocysteine methyltransferase
MNRKYCELWPQIKQRFSAWWRREKIDRPLMKILAKGKNGEALEPYEEPSNPRDKFLDVENIVKAYRNLCKTHHFLGDLFPSLRLDLGPSSMALYLGSEPEFAFDTIWYKEFIHEWNGTKLTVSSDSYWYRTHLEMKRKAITLANGDFLINIPDIGENLDTLASMRGTQNLCFDLVDNPDVIKAMVGLIDDAYFQFYDPMYEIAKGDDGGSSYTAFDIWGPGKTAKIGCDFCALMSPDQFEELVVPSIRRQCRTLDNSLFHLDGPDAIKHMDHLMTVEELDVFQWTPGAAQPDGGNERWYGLYDKARAAGKQLWVWLYDGGLADWVESSRKLVKRYGPDCLYIRFPVFDSLGDALQVVEASKNGFRY